VWWWWKEVYLILFSIPLADDSRTLVDETRLIEPVCYISTTTTTTTTTTTKTIATTTTTTTLMQCLDQPDEPNDDTLEATMLFPDNGDGTLTKIGQICREERDIFEVRMCGGGWTGPRARERQTGV
jgi:hypothetical protein